MTQATRIAAQLAPQRSTQYSNLARDLAAAELLASPLGPALKDVSMRSIAGQDYLQFSVEGALPAETADLLGSMAMLGGVFELFDAVGDVAGPLLRPIAAAHPTFVSSDMAATRRYKGKTNEAFTHFLCNMAKYASDFHGSDWSALDVVDPLCGGGTTLFAALSLGADVAGIDMDRTDIETTATFIGQYCRENRIPVSSKEERLRKLNARRWHFQLGKDDVRRCLLVHGDARDAKELLAGFGRPHLIVTDLPYGIQHNAPLRGLLGDCLPIWAELLAPGGALAFSWDATRFSREEMVELVSAAAPLAVVDRPPYDRLAHRVDRVIKRRDAIVARKRADHKSQGKETP
jgi:SAM-dependent methyltransferase